jgi:hypothetical protein
MIRRSFAHGLAVLFAVAPRVAFAESADEDAEDKRLRNRLELWHNFASRTRTLLVRLSTTRETSLLEAPLVTSGTLVFRAPDLLVLRDDGLQGSTTRIEGERVEVTVNAPGAPAIVVDRAAQPAAAWLADRLRGLFAPGDAGALVAGCRTYVPKGKGYRLELLPPRGSEIRKLVRSVTVHLDPVAGAVTEVLVAEAAGDRIRMQLSDHRQNLPDADIDRALTRG